MSHRLRAPIATSALIELIDVTPCSQKGGLGKAHACFGALLPKLLKELNETLAA